jgi:hypothetical protein
MRLTALTCACHRPEAWALCESYLKRQTRQPDQWIVLDDDLIPTVCTMGQEYHYNPKWRGPLSLCEKVRFVLENNLIRGDALVVWENDDVYRADYLETCERWLGEHDLVGEGRTVYYNVRERWWYEHEGNTNTSLCATALNRTVFPFLYEVACQPNNFVDQPMWLGYRGKKKVYCPDVKGTRNRLVVGIKAMPGRRGYSAAHTNRDLNAKDDPKLIDLTRLIGPDAENYRNFYVKLQEMRELTRKTQPE